VVCYHIHKTYEISEARDRETFYDVPSSITIPYVIFDGTAVVWEGNPNNYDSVYTVYVEAARSETPYYNLYIDSALVGPSTGRLNLKIVAVDTIPDDEIAVYINVLEDSLPDTGIPGVFLYHICRQQFSFPLEIAYPDTFDTTITFSHSSQSDKMKTVIFIQDIDTKEVMQSIISPFEEE